MRFSLALAAVAVAITMGDRSSVSAQDLPPQVPAIFYGSVTIDGEAPPPGAPVRGLVDGTDCTQPGAMGAIPAEDVGAYVIAVMHESQQPGCAREGQRITFTVGDREADQSADWAPGPQRLDLNAGEGAPKPLPDDVSLPLQPGNDTDNLGGDGDSPGTTPLPPGVAIESEDANDGTNLGAIAITALGALAVAGAAAGWFLTRRRQSDPDSPVD